MPTDCNPRPIAFTPLGRRQLLLVTRLRQARPAVKIVFRGDSGFCRWRLMRWRDRHGVGYVIEQAASRLTARVRLE